MVTDLQVAYLALGKVGPIVSEVRVLGVVAAPDRPSGRGGALSSVPVAVRARDRGLPLLQPSSLRTPDGIEAIARLDAELGVLADYGRIVPPAIPRSE